MERKTGTTGRVFRFCSLCLAVGKEGKTGPNRGDRENYTGLSPVFPLLRRGLEEGGALNLSSNEGQRSKQPYSM